MTPSVATVPGALDESLIGAYQADGIIQLTVPDSIRALQLDFLRDCALWLNHFGGLDVQPSAVPATLPMVDRQLVARLYKISRRFKAAKQLAAHAWFTQLAGDLMRTPLVSCCHFVNVRMDLPDEDTFLLPIHQDFPYIQGSFNGITVWLPFHDTPQEAGPPAWIPGSHTGGVQAVREQVYGTGPVRSGGRSFDVADAAAYADARFVSADVPFGTALVFSTLLVHRSQRNRSHVARLNVQLRYDDALAAESFERNYPEGLYLGDALTTTYPEHVQRA
jgi:hypothetical protein